MQTNARTCRRKLSPNGSTRSWSRCASPFRQRRNLQIIINLLKLKIKCESFFQNNKPPVQDLVQELRDGEVLLALLEILTAQRYVSQRPMVGQQTQHSSVRQASVAEARARPHASAPAEQRERGAARARGGRRAPRQHQRRRHCRRQRQAHPRYAITIAIAIAIAVAIVPPPPLTSPHTSPHISPLTSQCSLRSEDTTSNLYSNSIAILNVMLRIG